MQRAVANFLFRLIDSSSARRVASNIKQSKGAAGGKSWVSTGWMQWGMAKISQLGLAFNQIACANYLLNNPQLAAK